MLTKTPSAIITVYSVVYYGLRSTSKRATRMVVRTGSPGFPHISYRLLCLAFHKLGSSEKEGREALMSQDLMESRWDNAEL